MDKLKIIETAANYAWNHTEEEFEDMLRRESNKDTEEKGIWEALLSACLADLLDERWVEDRKSID